MAFLLGFDIGSSSIKVTLLSLELGEAVASATSPSSELAIESPRSGWAEQDPDLWWKHVVIATRSLLTKTKIDVTQIKAIGIAYQMHGLVLIGKDLKPIRPAIIWCDSRAVSIGETAFKSLGESFCLKHLLNSPGNFTASKIRWTMEHEPEVFNTAYKFLLPGDYIALKMCGEPSTTISGLSEGILWDFERSKISTELRSYYEIPEELFPIVYNSFEQMGELTNEAALELGLVSGIPLTYRAGDQPNNAFSLNVLESGEIATTAGTSGVVYGVSDKAWSDTKSRINIFAHVNHSTKDPHYGALLCVNGTGILNSWFKNKIFGGQITYQELNHLAESAPIGANCLSILPFGNGAERILQNREIGSSIHGIDFNRHDRSHICRAVQEGIVFALFYGMELMSQIGVRLHKIRAGHANMFQSKIFCEAFSTLSSATLELYNTDGSQGAARGAGLGAGFFKDSKSAFAGLKSVAVYEPVADKIDQYQEAYLRWTRILESYLVDYGEEYDKQ